MQLKMILSALLMFVVSACLSNPCTAWEYEDAIPFPRPEGVTPRDIGLENLSVNLTGLSVTIDYVIRNRRLTPFTGIYSIYLPPFAWAGVAAENSEQHFPDLKVEDSRGAIALRRNVLALHNGLLVTPLLNGAKIDPLLVANNDGAALDAQGSNGKVRTLVRNGIFDEVAGHLIPRWRTQVSYSWSQDVPAQKSISTRISYKSKPQFGAISYSSPELAALVGQHCATMDQLRAIFGAQGLPTPQNVVFQRIEIPFGLENDNLIKTTISSEFSSPIFGLSPSVSFVCSGNRDNPVLVGRPSLDSATIESPKKRISVLVISRQ